MHWYRVAAVLVLGVLISRSYADQLWVPDDAGIVDVKRDFGARGDGVTDDTEALRRAIAHGIDKTSRYASPAFVYFPEGTYLVSGPLEGRVEPHGWSGGWRAGMIMVGESREKSIIRLADDAPGYGDPQKPRWVVACGSESDKRTGPDDPPLDGGGNRAFRHNIMNLTIHTGSGNPGAIALDYVANNRGVVREVTLRSGDGAGFCGLRLERHWPGPALIKNVLIEGFDHGIRVHHYQYSMTFEHITLRNQRFGGLLNTNNALAIRGLRSENSVPVIQTGGHSLIVLIDSELSGGAADQIAITGDGKLYLRRVAVQGYRLAVDDKRANKQLPGNTNIDLYATSQYGVNSAAVRPVDLPIEETPQFHSNDPQDWVNVRDFEHLAIRGTWMHDKKEQHGINDWSPAIQAAIDSGKPIVYLPNGVYRVGQTIVLRGNVRMLTGFQSSLTPSNPEMISIVFGEDATNRIDAVPILRFEGAHPEGLIVQHLRVDGVIVHAGSSPWTVRHIDFGGYRNTPEGTGDMFFEDVIGTPIHVKHPQRVWGRQINSEFGRTPMLENHGGDVWVLGYKTEGEMVCVRQTTGRSEVLGAQFYPLGNRNPVGPAMINEGGRMSAALCMNSRGYQLYMGEAEGDAGRAVGWNEIRHRAAPLLSSEVPAK